MNKLDFFLAAMKAELYKNRAWIFTAFTVIQEGPDEWKSNPYGFRIVQTPTGHFFVDPNNNGELTKLEDTVANTPPFSYQERIKISHLSGVPNYQDRNRGVMDKSQIWLETNYGNLLANFICLIYPFGDKISYINKRIRPSDIEALILPRLKDTDDPIALLWKGEGKDPKWIYVDEYIRFTDAMYNLAGFASINVPAATRKGLLPPPGNAELKAKLIAANKDHLDDPSIVAKILAELQANDLKYLEGDDSLNAMLNKKKGLGIVRSKKFLMHGAETGLSEGTRVDLIQNSLNEGWDVSKFPAMNNSLRAGSFNRGAQTELGGEAVKWLLRASSNINITVDDCGTKLGMRRVITENTKNRYLGLSVVTESGPVKLTSENISSYNGKEVVIRSPQYCCLNLTDYCKTCVGERLANSPTGGSAAVAAYGSTMLYIFMSAMHGKSLSLAHMDYKTQIQ
jgi:hypothetical protein